MQEHAGNVPEDATRMQRVKDKLSALVTEAPKAFGAAKEKLPLDVAERTARTIWNKIKREKQSRDASQETETEKPLSRWELAARELQPPPLPNLHTTEQMLRSASAAVRSESEHRRTSFGLLLHELGFARRQQKAVEKIIAGNQQALESGNVREVRNPTTEGFEAYLSGIESPLPFGTNHSEVLKDDPVKNNDIDRTTSLIYALVGVREGVRSESWDPEVSRGKPLEMRGYKRAFSKREAGEQGDTLTSVIDSDHVTVIIDGALFSMGLTKPDRSYLTPEEIKANLIAMKASVTEPPDTGPGMITTMHRRDLHTMREELKKNPEQAAALQKLDTSLWTFVIDTEAAPQTLEQTSAFMQYGTYKEGPAQDSEEVPEEPVKRFGLLDLDGNNHYISPGSWYDGHSIRVTANGKAGGNFEHLAMDGSESMWMLDQIGMIAGNIQVGEAAAEAPMTFEPVNLSVPEGALQKAREDYLRNIEQQQMSVVEVPMEFNKAHYFDSSIQIALAAAQYEANGYKHTFGIEPMNLRHHMGGRLGYGLLNLHAMHKYVEWMAEHPERYDQTALLTRPEDMAKERSHAFGLSADARSSHYGMLEEVKAGNAALNHLTTLTGVFKDQLADKGAYVRDVEAFFTALDSGLYHMARGNVITNGGTRDNIEAFATISSVGADGIGIGYTKKDIPGDPTKGKIVFTIRAKGAAREKVGTLKEAIPKYLNYVMRDQLRQY